MSLPGIQFIVNSGKGIDNINFISQRPIFFYIIMTQCREKEKRTPKRVLKVSEFFVAMHEYIMHFHENTPLLSILNYKNSFMF